MESNAEARFHVGEVVLHTLFKYRGVVCDVDPVFQFDRRMVRNDGPLKATEGRALVPRSGGRRSACDLRGATQLETRRHEPAHRSSTCSATIFPSSTALRTYYVTAQIEASAILPEPLASEPLSALLSA